MKYLSEYRDKALVDRLADQIRQAACRSWTLMEVCGGQTHTFVKYGLERFLPSEVELVHGPGCPVCVTPMALIDRALAIAAIGDVIFCSFGDMLRVPGTAGNLLQVKARGGDIRIVYSPMDALTLAEKNPGKQVVFLAVGFETTAPANAMAVYQAAAKGIDNFSILVSHFLVPPALEAISASENSRIDGFLAAGHVCTITGYTMYEPLAQQYRVPIVVTGFEPADMLEGILMCIRQLEAGEYRVENQYARSVSRSGNPEAIKMMQEVFRIGGQEWRGIGSLPDSGLCLNDKYRLFDAKTRFSVAETGDGGDTRCISGDIMLGLKKPPDCPHFGTTCVPENPVGAPMVSSEGACAAYFRYRQLRDEVI